MLSMKEKFLEKTGKLDEGWSVSPGGVLVCPCGYRIEDDGGCPNGHVSPLKGFGII